MVDSQGFRSAKKLVKPEFSNELTRKQSLYGSHSFNQAVIVFKTPKFLKDMGRKEIDIL